jgi:hypothetical protein
VRHDNHIIEGLLSGLGKAFIGGNLPGNGKGFGSIRIKIGVLDEEYFLITYKCIMSYNISKRSTAFFRVIGLERKHVVW